MLTCFGQEDLEFAHSLTATQMPTLVTTSTFQETVHMAMVKAAMDLAAQSLVATQSGLLQVQSQSVVCHLHSGKQRILQTILEL